LSYGRMPIFLVDLTSCPAGVIIDYTRYYT